MPVDGTRSEGATHLEKLVRRGLELGSRHQAACGRSYSGESGDFFFLKGRTKVRNANHCLEQEKRLPLLFKPVSSRALPAGSVNIGEFQLLRPRSRRFDMLVSTDRSA
jgi:hypothetical protein